MIITDKIKRKFLIMIITFFFVSCVKSRDYEKLKFIIPHLGTPEILLKEDCSSAMKRLSQIFTNRNLETNNNGDDLSNFYNYRIKKSEKGWMYIFDQYGFSFEIVDYSFKDLILAIMLSKRYTNRFANGIGIGSDKKTVRKKFGKPKFSSDDKFAKKVTGKYSRVDEYNCIYFMYDEHNKVISIELFDELYFDD